MIKVLIVSNETRYWILTKYYAILFYIFCCVEYVTLRVQIFAIERFKKFNFAELILAVGESFSKFVELIFAMATYF